MVLVSFCAVDYLGKRINERKNPSHEGFEYGKSTRVLGATDGLSDGALFLLYVFALSFLLIDIMMIFFAIRQPS